MSAAHFTKSGNKATTPVKLDKSIFATSIPNHELLKAAYVTYLANGRVNLAQAKSRGEVRGGGKKPWRQKGTGRARFGSTRNPIWRGGGVAFGPTGQENYTKKLHVRAKRQALRQALTLSNEAGKLIIIESIAFSEPKTKAAAALLSKLGATGSCLVVVSDKTDALKRAFSNLPNVKLAHVKYLSTYDVLNADHLILTESALDEATGWLKVEAKK